jgi:hypothetical protein
MVKKTYVTKRAECNVIELKPTLQLPKLESKELEDDVL